MFPQINDKVKIVDGDYGKVISQNEVNPHFFTISMNSGGNTELHHAQFYIIDEYPQHLIDDDSE